MKDDLTTFGEAARELGLSYSAVSSLVSALNIEPRRVPRSGPAKGLTTEDMRLLRRVLKRHRREAPVPQA